MKTPCSIFFLFTALAAGGQTITPNQPVTATLDAAMTGLPISP